MCTRRVCVRQTRSSPELTNLLNTYSQVFCFCYAVGPAVIAGGGFDQYFKLASGEMMPIHLLVPLLVPLSLYSRHAAVPSNLTPILTLTLALTLTLTFTLTLTLTQTLTLTLTRHAAVPEAQRLGLEVLVTICAFLGPPLTPIGQPTEALVVLTVLLVSELLGYSFELQRRLVS